MTRKKKPTDKRLGERRNTERRLRRRRLKKDPPQKNRRQPNTRRATDRRGSLRRDEDTYLSKIQTFKTDKKTPQPLPPLEEEIAVSFETVDGFETSPTEDAPDPTNPDPESENN
mgnify:CR=1 FL=1